MFSESSSLILGWSQNGGSRIEFKISCQHFVKDFTNSYPESL